MTTIQRTIAETTPSYHAAAESLAAYAVTDVAYVLDMAAWIASGAPAGPCSGFTAPDIASAPSVECGLTAAWIMSERDSEHDGDCDYDYTAEAFETICDELAAGVDPLMVDTPRCPSCR